MNESSLTGLTQAWLSNPPGSQWLARTENQIVDANFIDLLAKHIEECAVWKWWGHISFKDPRPERRTKRAQKGRSTDDRELIEVLGLEESQIPIKPKRSHRPPSRVFDGIHPPLVNGIEVPWDPPKSVMSELLDPNTTAHTKPGWRYAQKVWEDFVEVSMGDIPLDDRSWVRVFEQQERGVPHIHFLMTDNEGSPRYMDMKDWLDERYGMSMIYPYKPARGAANYLCKYLLKDQGKVVEGFDIQFSPNLEGFDHV